MNQEKTVTVAKSRSDVALTIREFIASMQATLDRGEELPEYFHAEVRFSRERRGPSFTEERGSSIYGTVHNSRGRLSVYRRPGHEPDGQDVKPLKMCPTCDDPHPVFGKNRSKKDGHNFYCKKCRREGKRRYLMDPLKEPTA